MPRRSSKTKRVGQSLHASGPASNDASTRARLASTRLLESLCAVPTAPFAEQRVTAFVEQFVAERQRLKLERDSFGNLLISLDAEHATPREPRWVFTAHMDHPGFIARKMLAPRQLKADFRGGVRSTFFKGSRVRFFTVSGEVLATVKSVELRHSEQPYPKSALLKLEADVDVPRGTPGMWDQSPGEVDGSIFRSRVCDDLAGAAAALQMLDNLLKKPPEAPVAVLLTRAEEEGFIGALAASINPSFLRKTDRLIAIECSAMKPYAPQGKGAIIRVGDRTSIFNSALTFFLAAQATALAKRVKTFKFQRALMPGGTCEATVYDAYGFTAASICIALGNYHNMDVEAGKIAAEYVDLNDWHSMVALFTAVARNAHQFIPGHVELKQRLQRRFKKFTRPALKIVGLNLPILACLWQRRTKTLEFRRNHARASPGAEIDGISWNRPGDNLFGDGVPRSQRVADYDLQQRW